LKKWKTEKAMKKPS